MSKTWALVQNGSIVNTVIATSISYNFLGYTCVDITNYNPIPGIGWTTIDNINFIRGIQPNFQLDIINSYNITSSTSFSSSSSSDTLITGFSLVPQAGTYQILYSSSASATQNNATIHHTIYKNGTAITDSVRATQSVSSNFIFQQSTQTICQVDGTQSIDVRVSTDKGSLTVNQRSLILVRLGT